MIRIQSQFVLYLFLHHFDVGGRQIDLVDDGNDDQVVLHRSIEIGEGLSLHALRRVDEEKHSFARSEGARDLVGEIHVPRCVDQIEEILPSGLACIRQGDRLTFDRNSPLPLNIHVIEYLVSELPVRNHPGILNQAVRQRGLAVVDVCNDAEVANSLHITILYPVTVELVLPGRFFTITYRFP